MRIKTNRKRAVVIIVPILDVTIPIVVDVEDVQMTKDQELNKRMTGEKSVRFSPSFSSPAIRFEERRPMINSSSSNSKTMKIKAQLVLNGNDRTVGKSHDSLVRSLSLFVQTPSKHQPKPKRG